MYPVLFKIGTFEARTFGLLMVLAVVAGVWLALKRAPRFGIRKEDILDMAVWAVIAGIIGARLAYILMNWKTEFAGRPEKLLTLRFEGLTSFGALILGGLAVVLFARRKQIPVANLLDTVATPALIGWAIGRIGCLLNGCCYGRVCEAGLFCANFGAFGWHQPAQLVETAIMLLGLPVVGFFEQKNPRPNGRSFALALVVFNVSRFIYEFFRGGTAEEYRLGIASGRYLSWAPITEAQLTSLILLVVIGVWWLWQSRRAGSDSVAA